MYETILFQYHNYTVELTLIIYKVTVYFINLLKTSSCLLKYDYTYINEPKK